MIEQSVRERYNQLARQDFEKHKGKLLRLEYLCGYDGNISDDYECDVIVRVVGCDDPPHWNGEWLDPYWDVELIHVISGRTPDGAYWMDGPSYNAATEERDWRGAQPIGRMECLRIMFRSWLGRRSA